MNKSVFLEIKRGFDYCYNTNFPLPISKEYGLTRGSSGLIMAAYMLYRKTNDADYEKCLENLVNKEIDRKVKDLSFGTGLVGFCFSLQWAGLIKDALGEQQKEIETMICNYFLFDLYRFNLDYYRGASGTLLYLLSYIEEPKLVLLINDYVKAVDAFIDGDKKYREIKVNGRNNGMGVNFGTPHGLTGILLVLLKIYEKYKDPSVSNVISKVCIYIKAQMNNAGLWRFPSAVMAGGEKIDSGICWCYGDLMTGYAFLKAGNSLLDKELSDIGLNALHNCLRRLEYDKIYKSLCLCHGYSSLFQVLKHIYKITGDVDFWNGSENIRKRAVDMLTSSLYNVDDNKESSEDFTSFLNNSSMFFGMPGCIMSLLQDDEEGSEWMNFLLL